MVVSRRTLLAACAGAPMFAAAKLRREQLTSSTASLAGYTFEDALTKIAELGFGGVEILTFTNQKHSIGPIPGVNATELKTEERKRLRARVEKFRYVTTHLPFHGLRPVDRDPAIREQSQAAIRRGIEDSGFWGASIATVHIAAEKDYRAVWTDILDVYRRFGDLAAKHKVRIGIETGTPNTSTDYLDVIRAIDHPHVGGTVDTGHTRSHRVEAKVADADLGTENATKAYNDLLMRKVEGLGDKLIHFHIDDVRASDWREHRTPGTGIVDWQRLMNFLAKRNYKGSMALELEESPVVEALVQSQKLFKSLLV